MTFCVLLARILSTMKAHVCPYWNPMQNLVFQFSVVDSHFVKPGLTKMCFVGVNAVNESQPFT